MSNKNCPSICLKSSLLDYFLILLKNIGESRKGLSLTGMQTWICLKRLKRSILMRPFDSHNPTVGGGRRTSFHQQYLWKEQTSQQTSSCRGRMGVFWACESQKHVSEWSLTRFKNKNNWTHFFNTRIIFIPGTLNNHFLMVVSIGWFQIFTWEIVVWPHIVLNKLLFGGSRLC